MRLSLQSAETLSAHVDFLRLDVSARTDDEHRSEYGQFLTPSSIARFMGQMSSVNRSKIRVLDPGAGVGALSSSLIIEFLNRKSIPEEIELHAFELDENLIENLQKTLDASLELCRQAGVKFSYKIYNQDFIAGGVEWVEGAPFDSGPRFDCVIMNPPYKKINTASSARMTLSRVGIETVNLYTAFLGIAVKLLDKEGELIAITPRSFCNGPYYKPFRELFLEEMRLTHLHSFESRNVVFKDDDVLQENVIFRAVKNTKDRQVKVTLSEGMDFEHVTERNVMHSAIVRENDPGKFFHIVTDDLGEEVANHLHKLTAMLQDLGLTVSTGRVVDFRSKEHLKPQPSKNTVPLIYPHHFYDGGVRWPHPTHRKANAIVRCDDTENLMVPAGNYVLVKRFTSKEERRRVSSIVFQPGQAAGEVIGFENHLNYFHENGAGLNINLARGLSAYLNSTLVDLYFRQFNGHTQVNATDLRSMPFPSRQQLEAVGKKIPDKCIDQSVIDNVINGEVFSMSNQDFDPVRAKNRIDEAVEVLSILGLPREQVNERSGLTLLALLDLKPADSWNDAKAPMRGITEMMNYFSEYYKKTYAPNTRETVRRFTVHQFIDAGLIVRNPDKPSRPVNSPKNVYQVTAEALDLLKKYGSDEWGKTLKQFTKSVKSLKEQYARAREMERVPVTFMDGKKVMLSPGGQNPLVKAIVEEFCERFTPGSDVIYIGDTETKYAYFDDKALAKLGVTIESHGKMPDVVVYYKDKKWLILVEAVTSHGPVNPKRHRELKKLFSKSTVGLVYVTTFMTRQIMARYLSDIAWETEVWVAEAPGHLIHFNGERFLGPYEE